MARTYELWDVETGNIVGAFASEDDSVDVVRILLESYGRSYADDLTLSRRDGTGPSQIIAKGED